MARTRLHVLSDARARALGPLLKTLARNQSAQARLAFDPVELPRRYADPADIEVAGLIASSMAYGRASAFKPRIEQLLDAMGRHPARFARTYARSPDPRVFKDIRYRFNQPADFAALVAAIGWMSNTHGGLGVRFGTLLREGDLRSGLAQFAQELRDAPVVRNLLRIRGPRGLRYLLSDASLPGASKRWHLYLRWMVRGPDAVDLGVWGKFVPKAELLIPLDTHIARIAQYLGLTNRADLSWLTAEEITASLRKIDPADPVSLDFALCHHGMSGDCPPTRKVSCCKRCGLLAECKARAPDAWEPSQRTASSRGQ